MSKISKPATKGKKLVIVIEKPQSLSSEAGRKEELRRLARECISEESVHEEETEKSSQQQAV